MKLSNVLAIALVAPAGAEEACFSLVTQETCDDNGRCKWSVTDETTGEGECSTMCLDPNYKYKPYIKVDGHDKVKTKDWQECQSRCESVAECKHFSYWSWDKNCHISGEGADRIFREGVMSGMPGCTSCFNRWYKWVPYMGGRTSTDTPQECQERCQKTEGCAHFNWWSDKGCKIAGEGAKETKMTSKAPVSGPRNCEVKHEPEPETASTQAPETASTKAPETASTQRPEESDGERDSTTLELLPFVEPFGAGNGFDANIQAPRSGLGLAVGAAMAVGLMVLGALSPWSPLSRSHSMAVDDRDSLLEVTLSE